MTPEDKNARREESWKRDHCKNNYDYKNAATTKQHSAGIIKYTVNPTEGAAKNYFMCSMQSLCKHYDFVLKKVGNS